MGEQPLLPTILGGQGAAGKIELLEEGYLALTRGFVQDEVHLLGNILILVRCMKTAMLKLIQDPQNQGFDKIWITLY